MSTARPIPAVVFTLLLALSRAAAGESLASVTGRGRAGSEGDRGNHGCRIGFETTFAVDRTAYGVGDTNGNFLSKELQVRLAIAAVAADR